MPEPQPPAPLTPDEVEAMLEIIMASIMDDES